MYFQSEWNITIHHECPCWIEISHPKVWNFNQGQGLPSPWLNYDPGGEISLFLMDRLIMDSFSPTFQSFLSEHKQIIKHDIFNFLLIGYTLILSSQVFLSVITRDESQFAPCL